MGTMAYSRIMDTKGRKMIDGDFCIQARLSQHLKDIRLILEAAAGSRAGPAADRGPPPLLETAEAAGFGDADNSAVIRAYTARPARAAPTAIPIRAASPVPEFAMNRERVESIRQGNTGARNKSRPSACQRLFAATVNDPRRSPCELESGRGRVCEVSIADIEAIAGQGAVVSEISTAQVNVDETVAGPGSRIVETVKQVPALVSPIMKGTPARPPQPGTGGAPAAATAEMAGWPAAERRHRLRGTQHRAGVAGVSNP